jgi:hypothetical protein
MRLAALVLCLLLAGCPTPGARVVPGASVPPPPGYKAMCERDSKAPGCERKSEPAISLPSGAVNNVPGVYPGVRVCRNDVCYLSESI